MSRLSEDTQMQSHAPEPPRAPETLIPTPQEPEAPYELDAEGSVDLASKGWLVAYNAKAAKAESMFDPSKILINPAKSDLLSERLEHLSSSIRQSSNPIEIFKMQLKFVLLSIIEASPTKLEYSREEVGQILDVASRQLGHDDETKTRFLIQECFDEIFEFYYYQVSRPFDDEEKS